MDPTAAPTTDPTNSPSLSPTDIPSNTPTSSPTKQPTPAPTNYPSPDPTNAPSLSPTSTPITRYIEFALIINSGDNNPDYYSYFAGSFIRQNVDNLINGHYWWQQNENEGTKLFFSNDIEENRRMLGAADNVDIDTWILESEDIDTYWLLSDYNQYTDYIQPPLFAEWHYYINSSFIQNVADFTVYATKIETDSPTLHTTTVSIIAGDSTPSPTGDSRVDPVTSTSM